jgi:TonB-linked SusC/RagA family outer membrane protein
LSKIQAQELTITGRVNSPDDDLGMPGVNIIIKGSTMGAVTDSDGYYTINVPDSKTILVFSSIGYRSQEVSVKNRSIINIVLEEDITALEEIVVIGYGEVRKKDLTGAVSSVKVDETEAQQYRSIDKLLQGRAAGVYSVSSSSEPGSTMSIKIRGINSFRGNNEPLYVIDGLIVNSATEDVSNPNARDGNDLMTQQNGLTGINPQDIQSIEVLKDASATAIYGSRGANGVILITTKQGNKGRPVVNFTTQVEFGTIDKKIPVLSAEGYAEYQNSYKNAYPADTLTGKVYMDSLEYTDWQDEIYQTVVNQNYRLSLSGASEDTKYFVVGGYNKTNGVIPNSGTETGDLRLNLTQHISDRVKVDVRLSTFFNDLKMSKTTEYTGGINRSMIRQILSKSPITSDADAVDFGDPDADELAGPRAWLSGYDDFGKELRIMGTASLTWQISKAFKYQLRAGGDLRNKNRKIWYGTELFKGEQVGGLAGLTEMQRYGYNVDNMLLFNKKWNKIHDLSGTLAFTINATDFNSASIQAYGFFTEILRADGITLADNTDNLYKYNYNTAIISGLGRVNYTLKNRYLFTGTFRADGTSKFKGSNQWSYFPSAAFAWRISEESFLKNQNIASDLKLRLGWGITGNQSIRPYETYGRYMIDYYADASSNPILGIRPENLGNAGLTWEETEQFNAGLDLGFLDNRIYVNIDAYYKKTTNLLQKQDLSPSTGYSNFVTNRGSILNRGLEFSGQFVILDQEDWKWTFGGNISINRNEIGELGFDPSEFGSETYTAFYGNQISTGGLKQPANIFIEGKPMGLYWGYKTDGIIETDEEAATAPTKNGTVQAGDVRILDINGDSIINASDYTIIGDPNPDFTYGINTTVSWKGLSLSVFATGVYGNELMNANLYREAVAEATSHNIRAVAFYDMWTEDNQDAAYPRLGYDKLQNEVSDRLIEDGSYFRLAIVTLGYDIPVQKVRWLSNLNVNITARNLLTITNYSGYNPEVNSFSFDGSRIGVDWNSYPAIKAVSVGINATF